MEFNFKDMQAKMSEELAESNAKSKNGEESGYPLVYLGQNGKMIVKLFFNPKMGGLQRKLVRHPADAEGKTKVPCMKAMYGEDCPICEAIANIKQAKGDKCGVIKYAYKPRGICYAQIIDHDPAYCSNDKDPNKGDIVMLMYPKTIYDKVNQLMVDAGEQVGRVIASNSGLATVFSRSQKGNNYDYTVSIDALRGDVKSFDTVDEFDNFIDSLPNLNDAFVPSTPNEEIRTKVNATAQAIVAEFMGSTIVNPGSGATATVTPPPEFSNDDDLPFEIPGDDIPSTPVVETPKPVETPTTESTSGQKVCYGKHKDGDAECMNCPFECDCIVEGIS